MHLQRTRTKHQLLLLQELHIRGCTRWSSVFKWDPDEEFIVPEDHKNWYLKLPIVDLWEVTWFGKIAEIQQQYLCWSKTEDYSKQGGFLLWLQNYLELNLWCWKNILEEIVNLLFTEITWLSWTNLEITIKCRPA